MQFKHAIKPLIVFAAIPFGVVGALAALWLMGMPFGFMAFLGVVSLIGVIVSHIIVLFDFIEEMHAEGEPLIEALLDAGIMRLRPVMITVAATVTALFPLAAHGGPLWEPMCYAQIGGLTVATFVTLLLVPVLYAIFVLDLKMVQWAGGRSGRGDCLTRSTLNEELAELRLEHTSLCGLRRPLRSVSSIPFPLHQPPPSGLRRLSQVRCVACLKYKTPPRKACRSCDSIVAGTSRNVLWRAEFSRPPPAASSGLTNRYVSDAAIDRNGARSIGDSSSRGCGLCSRALTSVTQPSGSEINTAPDIACRRQDDLHRIERASPDVHRFVSQRVANRADAADISQEALLIACAKLATFRGDNLNAWLFAIARNLIIDYYRSQGRFTFVAVTPAEGETEPALQIPHDAVLAECEFRQRLSSWLECCTTSLDLEEQVAVLQSDVYDYRDKDSAAMLGMSVASFKLLLHGARARLKEIGNGRPPDAQRQPGPRPAGADAAGADALSPRRQLSHRRQRARRAAAQAG